MIFYCPKHPSKTAEYTKFSIVYKSGIGYPRTPEGNGICCPNKKCGMVMEMLDDPDLDYSTISVGKFSSMSAPEKREHIKKRAKQFNNLKVNKDHHRYQATNHLRKHG